jgi:hypothetical protein
MKYNKSKIADSFYQIKIYECPLIILEKLAKKASVGVTVENLYPERHVDKWFKSKQSLFPQGNIDTYRFRNAVFDVSLTNIQFMENMKFWNNNGVYAIFSQKSPIAFKATDIEIPARYKALKNFGFVLEFSLAPSNSDGWSSIVSPDKELIDLAKDLLNQR